MRAGLRFGLDALRNAVRPRAMPFAQIDVQVRFTTRCHDPLDVRQVDPAEKPSTRSLARRRWGSTGLRCLGVGEPRYSGASQLQQHGTRPVPRSIHRQYDALLFRVFRDDGRHRPFVRLDRQ